MSVTSLPLLLNSASIVWIILRMSDSNKLLLSKSQTAMKAVVLSLSTSTEQCVVQLESTDKGPGVARSIMIQHFLIQNNMIFRR